MQSSLIRPIAIAAATLATAGGVAFATHGDTTPATSGTITALREGEPTHQNRPIGRSVPAR